MTETLEKDPHLEDEKPSSRRFGLFLPLYWKKYLWDRARETHRSPPMYVMMLLEEDKRRHDSNQD